MYQQPDQAQIQHLMAVFLPFIGLAVLLGWAIIIIPFWQIFKKAGMGGALSLLMIIPLVNIIMVYVLAFSRWKVVPAPDFAAPYPPPTYPPAYPVSTYPTQPGSVASQASPAYVPPTDPPSTI